MIMIINRLTLPTALVLFAVMALPIGANAQTAAEILAPDTVYTPYTPAYGTTPVPAVPAQRSGRDTGGRFSVLEENDYFTSHDDRHYTQGIELSYLTTPVTAGDAFDQPFGFLHDNFGVYGGNVHKRKYEYIAGQSIFTPTNTEASRALSGARPYAAWLYAGANMLQDTDHGSYHTLENTELQLGVVGPPAQGDVTQNTFHQFIGDTDSLGWHNQLHTEPGGMLTYEKKWRFQQPIAGNFAVDAIPEAGATVGNIMTYGEVGGIVRIGQNLGADYGPNRIRPNVSGTGWFDPDQLNGSYGWYVYAGTQGRAVGHNIFLDGNSFTNSLNVPKKNLVADFVGGASLILSSAMRLDFSYTQRTREYYGQQGHPDHFGGINLAIGF